MSYYDYYDATLTWKDYYRWWLFLDMRILQNSHKEKISNFMTARSHRMIINWLLNSMYIFISPISTLYFNPIQNRLELTHFWDSPKTFIFGFKGSIHEILQEFFINFNSQKYLIWAAFMVVIMSIRFLRAANSIFDTFVGFENFFEKTFVSTKYMIASPGACSCGFTFKNLHF